MGSASVDRLEIEIEAQATEAGKALDELVKRLERLGTAVDKVSGKNLSKFADGVKNINKSADGMSQVSAGARKLSNSFNGLAMSANRGTKSFKSFAQTAGAFYANCFLLIRGIKKIGNAVNSAMDYIEAFNFFDVAISTAVEKGDGWAKAGYQNAQEYATAFKQGLGDLNEKMTGFSVNSDTGDVAPSSKANLGINITDLETFESEIVSVTGSLGLATQASYDTSKGLAMLAADMSSLHNIDLKTVMNNFQSGIIGQSRALYKYGIDITNATLATYAYKYGVSKSVSEMTQAEKMQLRMLAILDQSKEAWGDLANTINQPANQLRVFTSGVKNLAITIGKLLLPIVSAVLPYLNAMVKAMQRFFTWIASIAGIKLDAGNAGVATSDIFDSIGDGADDATDSVNDTNKAIDKLKRNVFGYDELNKRNDNSDSSSKSGSGGSGDTIDLTNAINAALADYEKAWDEAYANMTDKATAMADAIVDAFKRKDYKGIGTYISNGITSALNAIPWESIYSVASQFGTGFAEFLNGLITPDLFGAVGRTIASALNTAIYTSLSFATTFDWSNLGLSLASGINNFFETFDFASAAETVNTWAKGLFETVKTAVANIDWWEVYSGINDFFKNIDVSTVAIVIGALTIKKIGSIIIEAHIFKTIASVIGAEISSSIAAVISSKLGLDIAKGAGLSTAFLELGKRMGNTFMAGFKALFGSEAATSALAFINPIITAITGITSIIGGAITAVVNFFAMWKDGFSWLNEILMNVGIAIAAIGAVILGVAAAPAAIAAAVVAAVATVAIVVKDHWEEISSFFSGVADWFNENVITPTAEFFKDLCDKVSGFFKGLWDDICNVWQAVSGWFDEHVIEPIAGFFQGLWTRVKQIFEGLWIIVQAVWIVASDWFNEHVVTPVVGFFQGLWETVSGFFSQLWSDIKSVWSTVADWFNSNVIEPVVGFFRGVWEKVSGFFTELWNGIKDVWSNVSSWFDSNVITPVTNSFSTLWRSIKKGLGGAMNAVIGGIEDGINYIVNSINKIIGGFNKVVSWAAKVAEVDWGGVDLVPNVRLGRINVDAYADGGFPETGQLFMARENGLNEMVGRIGNRSAVANNDQIIEGIKTGVTQAMMEVMMATQNTQKSADNRPVNVILELNGNELGRASFRSIEDLIRSGQIKPKFEW